MTTQKKKNKKRSYKILYEQCKKWYAIALWSSANIDDKNNFEIKWTMHNWLLEQNQLDPIPFPSGNEILIRMVSKDMISIDFASKIMDISKEELYEIVDKKKNDWFVI